MNIYTVQISNVFISCILEPIDIYRSLMFLYLEEPRKEPIWIFEYLTNIHIIYI